MIRNKHLSQKGKIAERKKEKKEEKKNTKNDCVVANFFQHKKGRMDEIRKRKAKSKNERQ